MVKEDSHHSLLALIALIALVGFVGLVTVARMPSGDITGMAIVDPADSYDCDACEGEPVCVAVGQRAVTVDTLCTAVCSDMHVIAEVPCDKI